MDKCIPHKEKVHVFIPLCNVGFYKGLETAYFKIC